jgi:hypothetical protein
VPVLVLVVPVAQAVQPPERVRQPWRRRQGQQPVQPVQEF